MSTISGISGGSHSAWADVSSSSSRAASRRERLFEKADSNGDGSVDATELQGLLDEVAKRNGTTAASASDTLKTMDTDGNGSLSADELDAGMKNLLPPPSSTVDFAQQRGADGAGALPSPPPPDDPSSASTSTDSASDTSTTAAASTDSTGSTERTHAHGHHHLNAMMADLFQAADTDGDGTLSSSEVDTLKQNLDAALQSLQGAGSTSASSDGSSTTAAGSTATSASAATSNSGTDSGAGTTASGPDRIEALMQTVLKEYAAHAASASASTFADAASATSAAGSINVSA